MKKSQKFLEQHTIPSLRLVLTDHAVERMTGRMPIGFALPDTGAFIRPMTVKDTYRNVELIVVRLKGGVIICKWNDGSLVVVTMLTDETFHKLQQRRNSRFMPIKTACFQVTEVLIAPRSLKAAKAT